MRTSIGSLLVVVTVAYALYIGALPAQGVDATMRFVGAMNVLGVISSINVDPASVSIPAGGEVEFVNATGIALTLTVSNKSVQVGAGASAFMDFGGAAQPETFVAAATALPGELVGALTPSIGRVLVGPLPARDQPQGLHQPRKPRKPQRFQPSPAADPPGPTASRSSATTQSGSATPSEQPSAKRSGASPTAGAVAPSRGARPSKARDRPPPSRAPAAAKVSLAPVLPPFPGFSNTRDQLGLALLLSAAVLGGLIAALVRTLLAYRPLVLVGAHSQAARKARRLRRAR